MNTRELRNCPFCGSDARYSTANQNWVFCMGCKASMDNVKEWNTRITDPRPETIKDYKPMSNAEESAWREE